MVEIVNVIDSKVELCGFYIEDNKVLNLILSVKEDQSGIPEPPRFRTKEESEPVGCDASILIKNLIKH